MRCVSRVCVRGGDDPVCRAARCCGAPNVKFAAGACRGCTWHVARACVAHGVARAVRRGVQGGGGICASHVTWIVNRSKGNKRCSKGFGGGCRIQLKYSSFSMHCLSSSSCQPRYTGVIIDPRF
jgi:hypothetical protein